MSFRERFKPLIDSQPWQHTLRLFFASALLSTLAFGEPQTSTAQEIPPEAPPLSALTCKDHDDILKAAQIEVFGKELVDPAVTAAHEELQLDPNNMAYGTDTTASTETLTPIPTVTYSEWQLQALNRVLGANVRPEFTQAAPFSETVVITLPGQTRVISYTNDVGGILIHADTGFPLSTSQAITDARTAGKLINGLDLVAYRPAAYPPKCNSMDDHGHVTEEVSVIIGHPEQAIWSVGDELPMTVIYMKILNYNKGGSWTDVRDALLFAGKLGADVINLSLTGPIDEKRKAEVDAALKYAVSKGVLVVVAAGNANTEQLYPNCAEEELLVRVVASGKRLLADGNGGVYEDIYVPDSYNTQCIDKLGYAVAIPGDRVGGRNLKGQITAISGSSTAAAELAHIVTGFGGHLTNRERLTQLQENGERLPHLIQENSGGEAVAIPQYQFELCGYTFLCDFQNFLPIVNAE